MDIKAISNIIFVNIKKERGFGEEIIQNQKKTWLKFDEPISSNLHKPITRKLKREGETIKWLSDNEIEIKLG